MVALGRNSPCRCGGGKKYKHCCLPADERAPGRRAEATHAMDRRLVDRVLAYGAKRHREEMVRAWEECPVEMERTTYGSQIIMPWIAFHCDVGGRSLLERFLAAPMERLGDIERAWLEAQGRARLSAWEVVRVERGTGLALKDLLTCEERFVYEVRGSEAVTIRHSVLARVVDWDGISVICGMHPMPLPPSEAAEWVAAMRHVFRVREGTIPAGRLREDQSLPLISMWEAAAEYLRSRPSPEIVNRDGDPLVCVEDLFSLRRGARAEVEDRLAGLRGADVDRSDDSTGFTFVRPDDASRTGFDNTVIGDAMLEGDTLAVRTNSVKRGDALRERVEAACRDLLVFRERTERDLDIGADLDENRDFDGPDAAEGTGRSIAVEPFHLVPGRDVPEGLDPDGVVRELKRKHYERWLDMSIPALDGMTPREAASRPSTRSRVDVLLKEMESNESHQSPRSRIDVSALRQVLGLPG